MVWWSADMLHMNKNRKAQLTIFIILGVIIIVGAGILLLLRGRVAETEVQEVTEEVPLEVKPIQEFVSSCLFGRLMPILSAIPVEIVIETAPWLLRPCSIPRTSLPPMKPFPPGTPVPFTACY